MAKPKEQTGKMIRVGTNFSSSSSPIPSIVDEDEDDLIASGTKGISLVSCGKESNH